MWTEDNCVKASDLNQTVGQSTRVFFLKVAHRKEENTDSEQNVKGLEVE